MKTIKISIIAISLFLSALSLKAQQLPLYSQYMMNGFLLNPAIAGDRPFAPVCLTARQQWVGIGIKNAPQTVAISGHTLLGRAEGVGGYIFNDMFGPIRRTGLLAAYAHHLSLGAKNKLSFGASLSAFQYSLDETQLNIGDNTPDPAFSNKNESTFVPDANFGVYFYGDDSYFAGVSVAQLFQWNIKVGSTSENKLVRHYFVTGGYKFPINKDFKVEPSVLFKTTESSPFQVDVNCKAYYKKNYWLGFSYRTDNSIIALLGVKYKNLFFGYAFDYSVGKIANYTSGSHEIMLGINIGEKENRGSSLL